MPNRIIKESAFTSEKISSLSDFQFRLWVGLITLADDRGNGDARPEIIKGRLFAFRRTTAKDIEDALRALAAVGCVSFYMVDGKPYFQFPNWGKHQRIYNSKPKYPGPDESDDDSEENDAICGELPQDAASCGDFPLISKSKYKSKYKIYSSASADAGETDFDDFFEQIWRQYPKKKGKNAVTKKAKAEIYAAGAEMMQRAIDNYKAEIRREGTDEHYVLHGSTFFNGRWRDYIDEPSADAYDLFKEKQYVTHNGQKIEWTLDYPCPIGRGLTPEECEALGVSY